MMTKKKLTIIKIGGKVVDDNLKLNIFLEQFVRIKGKKLLVHGGGKTASEILQSMGLKPNMVFGRRVTDAETLKVVQMVYGGLINTDIVANLQSKSCNAIGMNGSDANTILALKRPVNDVDFGFVGDIVKINYKAIMNILEDSITPVFCALTHDGKGQILNTNADSIASSLGSVLAEEYKVSLFYCFELSGIMENPADETSLIKIINEESYSKMKENKTITDGMIPKVDNALGALKKGVDYVYITNYRSIGKLHGTRVILT